MVVTGTLTVGDACRLTAGRGLVTGAGLVVGVVLVDVGAGAGAGAGDDVVAGADDGATVDDDDELETCGAAGAVLPTVGVDVDAA